MVWFRHPTCHHNCSKDSHYSLWHWSLNFRPTWVQGNGMISHFPFGFGCLSCSFLLILIKMYTKHDEQEKSYIWYTLAVLWQLQFVLHPGISLISVYRLKKGIIQIVILAELLRIECLMHLIWTVIHNSLRVDELMAVGCPLVNIALDNHSCDKFFFFIQKHTYIHTNT